VRPGTPHPEDMSGKKCEKCSTPYTGFGTIFSDCRKTKGAAGGASAATGAASDKCVVCGKTAYAMERIQVEGAIFHPACFKCAFCDNKLSVGSFSKSDDGKYYCKTHYERLFKIRGRYELDAPADYQGGQKPASAAPAETAETPAPEKAETPAPAATGDSRAKFEEGFGRWTVQGVSGGEPVNITEQEKHHTVQIFKCSNATVIIKGKVNSVSIDSCTNTQVVMDDVISAVEVMNSKSVKFQISGSCPSASIDKTDGCNVYLMSEEARNMQISTSKHSDVQVTYMDKGEPIEKPIPEQFVHSVEANDTIKSDVSSLYSGGANATAGAQVDNEDQDEGTEEAAAAGPTDPRAVFAENGKRWTVEAVTGGKPIMVTGNEKSHTVFVYKCKDATVVIKGKINSVAIDSCTNTQVVMDTVISTVEVSNGKKIKFQITAACPMASVDKTDSCAIYLMSDKAKKMQLMTSKHSDIQLTYMKGEDPIEKPIPEQFVHIVEASGAIKSTVSSLYSG